MEKIEDAQVRSVEEVVEQRIQGKMDNPYLSDKCAGCKHNDRNIWCTDHDGRHDCHASSKDVKI